MPTANVKRLLDNPGLYMAHLPGGCWEAPLISMGGRVFSVKVETMKADRALDPEGFDPDTVFTGPMAREVWARGAHLEADA